MATQPTEHHPAVRPWLLRCASRRFCMSQCKGRIASPGKANRLCKNARHQRLYQPVCRSAMPGLARSAVRDRHRSTRLIAGRSSPPHQPLSRRPRYVAGVRRGRPLWHGRQRDDRDPRPRPMIPAPPRRQIVAQPRALDGLLGDAEVLGERGIRPAGQPQVAELGDARLGPDCAGLALGHPSTPRGRSDRRAAATPLPTRKSAASPGGSEAGGYGAAAGMRRARAPGGCASQSFRPPIPCCDGGDSAIASWPIGIATWAFDIS